MSAYSAVNQGHVTVAFDIPHPHPFTTTQYDIQRVVVVRAVTIFQSDKFLGGILHQSGHNGGYPCES